MFSERGFDGASIRDIARVAGVQGALVSHHGGSKEALFEAVVARRAEVLAKARQDALAAAKAQGRVELRDILAAFVEPLSDRVAREGAAWLAYGRLIAHVSADPRWRGIAERYFDPTAQIFLDALAEALPDASRAELSTRLVFMVSSMLSIFTSAWRMEGLAPGLGAVDPVAALLAFSEAGFRAHSGHAR
ncbi:TetR family transcriptional regulator [Rhodobacteraceae bacterium D3-12]|nr:TetR family transcriptional regulator [Rhodobacteraceae bacterium D3-12]